MRNIATLHRVVRLGAVSSNSTTRIQSLLSELMTCSRSQLVGPMELVLSALEDYLSAIESDELRAVFVESMHIEEVVSSVGLVAEESASFVLWLERLRGVLLRNTRPVARRIPVPETGLPSSEQSQTGILRVQAEFDLRNAEWSKLSTKTAAGPPPFALSLDSIRSHAAASDDTLLCYAMSSDGVLVQQFDRSGERLWRLGSFQEISPAIEAVRLAANMVLRGPRYKRTEPEATGLNRLERSLKRLDTLLSPPTFGSESVSIVANGLLTAVPWNLLPSFSNRTVTLFPALAEWIIRPPQTDQFSQGANRIGLVCGPGLEHGMLEVNSISTLYDESVILAGAGATVRAVQELLETVDVAHIVAHGSRRADSAFFSGIELFDGLLMGYEVAELRRVPRRVVLSCCELGAANSSGMASSFGFVASLRRPAVFANGADLVGTGGALEVAAPVLLIDDAETVGAMVAVHQQLRSGLGLSAAVAKVVASTSGFWQRLSAGSFNTTGRS